MSGDFQMYCGSGAICGDPVLRYVSKPEMALLTFKVLSRRLSYAHGIQARGRRKKQDERRLTLNVQVWGDGAVEVSDRIRRNDRVVVEGTLVGRPWTDVKGQHRYTIWVNAYRVEKIDRHKFRKAGDARDEEMELPVVEIEEAADVVEIPHEHRDEG